ncbi:MAG: hypothetical protein Tsb002_28720 [Wenzhouxiangellaceae bacterium]
MTPLRSLVRPLLILLLSQGLTLVATAAPGSWSGAGPEGGNIQAITADPFTPNRFYVVTRSGVFQSTDGGLTWSDASVGISRSLGQRIKHSRTSPGVVYALSGRALFHTSNAAMSWTDRSPPLAAGEFFLDLDLAPSMPGRIYLTATDNLVRRSDDGGLSWSIVGAPPGVENAIIAVMPTDANQVLLAGTDSGGGLTRLFRTLDGGVTWVETLCGGSCPWSGAGFNSPSDMAYAGVTGQVYLIDGSQTYKSVDFGLNWVLSTNIPMQRLAVNPTNFNEVYLAGGEGVALTVDGGATWTHDITNFLGTSTEVARSTVIAYDPFNPNLVLAGSLANGVYRRPAPPAAGGSAVWTMHNSGIPAQTIRAIAIAPGGSRVHAAVGDAFGANRPSFRSLDGAATWSLASTNLDAFQFRALVIDPNDTNILYAGGRKNLALDNMGMNTSGNGGIYKSTDAGLSWTTIDNGIPLTGPPFNSSFFGTVRTIALDQFSALGGSGPLQTLYAGGTGRLRIDMGMTVVDAARIYKSTDAGASWSASDNGLGGVQDLGGGLSVHVSVVQLIQSPGDMTGNTLYAATFLGGCCNGGLPLPILDNGVFKSTDGGATWNLFSNGLPRVAGDPMASHQDVLSMALDPTDATGNTLYASVNDPQGNFLGTIYKTVDGGLNWSFAGTGLGNRDVREILVDAATGDVYAAAVDPLNNGDGGVFQSVDGGANWTAVGPGFPPQASALKLALDRSGANPILHAGTTRSVLSIEFLPDIDTDGASDTIEMNAPNGGDGNLDGIGDDTQAAVASLLRQPFADGSLQGASYVTASVTPISGNCSVIERVESVRSENNPAALPLLSGFRFPGGVLRLRIPDCSAAELEVIYHNLTFDAASDAYVYTPPDVDAAFVWNRFDTAIASANTWTYTLNDGDSADATGAVDGVILFQGGPAELAETFFRDSLEVE